jgi:hypothetical protein
MFESLKTDSNNSAIRVNFNVAESSKFLESFERVKQDGFALEYAAEELKGCGEIVMAAVKQFGWALEYASDELKDDPEMVLAQKNYDLAQMEELKQYF